MRLRTLSSSVSHSCVRGMPGLAILRMYDRTCTSTANDGQERERKFRPTRHAQPYAASLRPAHMCHLLHYILEDDCFNLDESWIAPVSTHAHNHACGQGQPLKRVPTRTVQSTRYLRFTDHMSDLSVHLCCLPHVVDHVCLQPLLLPHLRAALTPQVVILVALPLTLREPAGAVDVQGRGPGIKTALEWHGLAVPLHTGHYNMQSADAPSASAAIAPAAFASAGAATAAASHGNSNSSCSGGNCWCCCCYCCRGGYMPPLLEDPYRRVTARGGCSRKGKEGMTEWSHGLTTAVHSLAGGEQHPHRYRGWLCLLRGRACCCCCCC